MANMNQCNIGYSNYVPYYIIFPHIYNLKILSLYFYNILALVVFDGN
uniref:Uncharacterized protein n=1 Tax=Arundo donax TaxID=35708 RepID=A0A0A9GJA1_ARUDO